MEFVGTLLIKLLLLVKELVILNFIKLFLFKVDLKSVFIKVKKFNIIVILMIADLEKIILVM